MNPWFKVGLWEDYMVLEFYYNSYEYDEGAFEDPPVFKMLFFGLWFSLDGGSYCIVAWSS